MPNEDSQRRSRAAAKDSKGQRKSGTSARQRARIMAEYGSGRAIETIDFTYEGTCSSIELDPSLFGPVHIVGDEVGQAVLSPGQKKALVAPPSRTLHGLPSGPPHRSIHFPNTGNGYQGKVPKGALKPATGQSVIPVTASDETQDGLPVVYEDEAVKGWKIAFLNVSTDGKSLHLTAGAQQYHHEVNAIAICTKNNSHKAPDLNCSCGFYSYRSVTELRKYGVIEGYGDKYRGQVLLEVDLTGDIIEHERLLRAEHQVITTVYLHGMCFECDTPAEKVMFTPARTHKSLCGGCAEKESDNALLVSSKVFDISDLSNMLGMECRFYGLANW